MGKKKFKRHVKKLLPKMFTYPFTRDLNLTTHRRHALERLFVNSDSRCTFLPRNTYQIVPLDDSMYLLRLNINSMCLATDIPKRTVAAFRTHLHVKGTIARIFFIRAPCHTFFLIAHFEQMHC